MTGASSGIGAALAEALAARGVARLVLVARSTDRLEALAGALRTRHGTQVVVLPADLADADAPARVREETDRRGLVVDLLVNNAGFGSYGYFDEREMARETEMVTVNVAAVVVLTRLFLPDMLARGRGAILNVASTAAFQPVPFMATYGATKAFVLSFSEALWAENHERGVRVVCLCPGGTKTRFDEGLSERRGWFERFPQSSAEEVAAAGLDGLERNASYVVVGRANYAGTLLARFAPRALAARVTGGIFRPPSARKGHPGALRCGAAALGVLAGAALVSSLSARGTPGYARRRGPGTADRGRHSPNPDRRDSG